MNGEPEFRRGGAGVYVHLPFCIRRCPYCDFFSTAAGGEGVPRAYLDALLAEARCVAPLLGRDAVIDTIYLGGGTPSLLTSEQLAFLLDGLRSAFPCTGDGLEVTIEINPASVREEWVVKAADSGVNRMSVGVQSLDEAELSFLGRLHSVADVWRLSCALETMGIEWSADLMYGFPSHRSSSWERTLRLLLERHAPPHVSCYAWHAGEESAWSREGGPPAPAPRDDDIAAMFEKACRLLEKAGLRRYEFSNFARPGCESRHNLKYWTGADYMGLGAGAWSRWGPLRWKNAADVESYVAFWTGGGALPTDGVLDGGLQRWVDSCRVIEECWTYSALDVWRERVVMGMRLACGLSEVLLRQWSAELSIPAAEVERVLAVFADYGRLGLVEHSQGRWRFTTRGVMLSNELLCEIYG